MVKAPSAGGTGSVLRGETKILCVAQHGLKKLFRVSASLHT